MFIERISKLAISIGEKSEVPLSAAVGASGTYSLADGLMDGDEVEAILGGVLLAIGSLKTVSKVFSKNQEELIVPDHEESV